MDNGDPDWHPESGLATAATYEERKAIAVDTGECIEPGCDDQAVSGSFKCLSHRDLQREHDREYRAKLRKRRRRKRQCRDCGKKLRKGERTWCTRHRIRHNRLKSIQREQADAVVRRVVEKSERIAARTVTGDDGRTRYHGQERRGQQTHAQLDEQDLGFARHEITRGELALTAYETEAARAKASDPEAMPRIQRDGLRSDAMGYFERAARHLSDVLGRHGHVMQRHGRRDGE